VPISLTIPLANILSQEGDPAAEKACHEKQGPCPVAFVPKREGIVPGCGEGGEEGGIGTDPGNPPEPWSVQPGSLCVYGFGNPDNAKVTGFETASRERGGEVSPTGVIMTVEFPEASGGEASGIWAVRAPTS
jgi:hypothetical protein